MREIPIAKPCMVMIAIAISLAAMISIGRSNGYSICCRNFNDCSDDSCCGCFDSATEGCSNIGAEYVACPLDAGGCVAAGCGASLQTTTTTVVPSDDCQLLSAEISSTCSVGGCRAGDTIMMSGSYSGNCAAENFFQIDAVSTDGDCDISFFGGDMRGIMDFSSYCYCGSVTGYWTIPLIPPQCLGRTIVPTYGALYSGGNPEEGAMITDTWDVDGSVDFARCSCDGWAEGICSGDGCLPGQMLQTRTCDPSGCDQESRCLDPSLISRDLGCGILCEDAGQCGFMEQCISVKDLNRCAEGYFGCTYDESCTVACDGIDTIEYHLWDQWNALSIPCSDVEVVSDTCGVTDGSFYYYDGDTGRWNVSTVGIGTLRRGMGYWFYSDGPCDFTLMASTGADEVYQDDIAVNGGWNQIGSPTRGMMDPMTSLKECRDCEDGLCSSINLLYFNPLSRTWLTPEFLSPGHGYSLQCVD